MLHRNIFMLQTTMLYMDKARWCSSKRNSRYTYLNTRDWSIPMQTLLLCGLSVAMMYNIR
ncbi:hypothetical protein M3J09_012061 [Ascochyta lentis]